MIGKEILELEIRGCFDFFWNETNHEVGSPGYGLVPDRSDNGAVASIAAVGFGLTAYVIGVKRGYITYEQGMERVKGTLLTLLNNVPHVNGFFIHFCYMDSAERLKGTEFSTIDTALALNGIITVDQFFDDDEIHTLSQAILTRVDWGSLIYEDNGKTMLRMAYSDDTEWEYTQGRVGFYGGWTMCAEQLMMYILAAGRDEIDAELAKRLYLGFDRPFKEYSGYGCYYEPGGTLFVYQYSHAWFDFSRYKGCDGIDWAENSKNATLAQIEWCKDHQEIMTFREGLWGVSASDSPNGYAVQGTEPCSRSPRADGTIAPCAIAGSLPFVYEESEKALCYLYEKHPGLWGKYGFKDAYNAEGGWYASTYFGIDKGETILMLANALYGDVWECYMAHPMIQSAIRKLGMEG